MKNAIVIGIFFLLAGKMVSYSQVSVNSDGLSADPSAILDVRSTDKGFLVPRLTKAQRIAVNSPAPGLMVFQTDNVSGFYFYSSEGWSLIDKPCGEAVEYGGMNYHTVQIGSQCWFRENLNIGISIPLNQAQSDNQQIEKYCIHDCIYGGLYQYREAMNYNTSGSYQGICPPGWHVSSDNDWITLEGTIDGMYDSENLTWQNEGFRGFDIGRNMKSKNIWFKLWDYYPYGVTDQGVDLYDFNALPGSRKGSENPGQDTSAYFWCSASYYFAPQQYSRTLFLSIDQLLRTPRSVNEGFSVRCVKNCPTELIQSNAGNDQLNIQDTSITLQANDPSPCVGHWSIVSGSGGNFEDPLDPAGIFCGIEGNSYTLRWTISNTCSSSRDTVVISFACPQANGGSDQLNLTDLTTTLQGNTPTVGTGQWSIISGVGGILADPLNPESGFTAIEGGIYALKWEITSNCPISRDTVSISFACPTANAGPDQVDVAGTTTTLQATAPFAGTGLWTIVNGSGGSITTPSDPVSTFTGVPGCLGYTLRWTVTSNCTLVYDDVQVNFACTPMPTVANAGADQANVAGVTTTLQGNTAEVGTAFWTLMSGANGIIAQPSNPASLFTGTNGTSYVLKWTITNACCTTVDYVTISFAAFSCGNSFQDTRDGKAYTTVLEGSQCWMKQNLNFAASGSACYAGNPTNCDNYGRLYDWTMASTACPTGWHLPTDGEWCTLASGLDGSVSCGLQGVLGTDAGGKMKETGTTYWQTPNTGATNSSGFSARGGGTTTISGHNLTQWGSFWTATTIGSNRWSWEMTYSDARIWRTQYGTSNTMSVRCLKN